MTRSTLAIGGPKTEQLVASTDSLTLLSAGYAARTSLAVLTSPAANLALSNLSEFRRRLVERDLSRSLLVEVLGADVVVVDATEERFALVHFPDGKLATRSPEFLELGLDPASYTIIATGTDEHFELWRAGFDALVDTLVTHDRLRRLRIHEALIDEQRPDGSEVLGAVRVNRYLVRLYGHMRSTLPKECFVTSGPGLPTTTGWADDIEVEDTVAEIVPPHDVAELLAVGRGEITRRSWTSELGEPITETARTVDAATNTYRWALPSGTTARNGIALRFRFSGWERIDSSWVGDESNVGITRVTLAHPQQDGWITEVLGSRDPALLRCNGWKGGQDRIIDSALVGVTGVPGPSARVDLEWVCTFHESPRPHLRRSWREQGHLAASRRREHIANLVARQFTDLNPHLIDQAKLYLDTGRLPVYKAEQALDWPSEAAIAPDSTKLGTYRYLHHALNLTAGLMILAQRDDDELAAAAGRELLTEWLDRHFYQLSDDTTYAWYDHGTAMRTLTMLLTWQHYCASGRDARFTARLEQAIEAQAHLLTSESFYGCYQKMRHQNHAWFQDLALMAVGAWIGESNVGQSWLRQAGQRLDEQFETLIVTEGIHSIWSENSVGYHKGLIPLIEFSLEMGAECGWSPTHDVLSGMRRWLSDITYPDSRTPAIGDTFPSSGPRGKLRSTRAEGLSSWPGAGYAQVVGRDDAVEYQLFVTASAVNEVHKHADNGSFTLWADGVEWLIDPGLVSYDPNDGPALYARGPWAHNSIALKGVDYDLSPGLAKLEGSEGEGLATIRVRHSNYPKHSITRVLSLPLNRLVLRGHDQASGPAAATATAIFHFGPAVEVRITDQGAVLTHPAAERALLLRLPGDGRLVRGWAGTAEESSLMGTALSQWVDTTSLLVSMPADGLDWTVEMIPRAEAQSIPDRVVARDCRGAKPSIAIIGSCVTRDAFQREDPDFELAWYLARTSLGSMFAPAPGQGFPTDLISSAFQRRMVEADLKKQGTQHLRRDFDWLIYDPIDERFRLAVWPDGGVATLSAEFSTMKTPPTSATQIEGMGDEHFELWKAGWARLRNDLQSQGRLDRLLVHVSPWATTVRNEPGVVPLFDLPTIEHANRGIERMITEIAKDLPESQFIRLDPTLVMSYREHQWGISPFHYIPEYYEAFRAELRRVTQTM